jgi:hypothetical protein
LKNRLPPGSRTGPSVALSAAERLWRDFTLHLDFLKQEGFVDADGRLTDDGRWAAHLRLDYPFWLPSV